MSILERAQTATAAVTDPELPMLTLSDLGVLRGVEVDDDLVTVTLTPTYTGCPAMDTIRADVLVALHRAGIDNARIRTSLSPAWSSDDITPQGRQLLAEHGIAPPGAAPRHPGPIPVSLGQVNEVSCPHCGAVPTRLVSRFGATACRAIRTCPACLETFEHVKEI